MIIFLMVMLTTFGAPFKFVASALVFTVKRRRGVTGSGLKDTERDGERRASGCKPALFWSLQLREQSPGNSHQPGVNLHPL